MRTSRLRRWGELGKRRSAVTQDATQRLVVTQTPTVEWNSGTYGPVHVLYNPGAANTGTDPFNYSFTMYYDGTTGGVEVHRPGLLL